MNLEQAINHLRNRVYMSGAERDRVRIKATAEVFTPTEVAQHMLAQIDPIVFTDVSKTILDPACGDGQLLSEVVLKRMENGFTLEESLSNVYGVDIMRDNVDLCKKRLNNGGTIIMGNTLSPKERLEGQTEEEYAKMIELFCENEEESSLGAFFTD